MRRPDYADATPEDLARALMPPRNAPWTTAVLGDQVAAHQPPRDKTGKQHRHLRKGPGVAHVMIPVLCALPGQLSALPAMICPLRWKRNPAALSSQIDNFLSVVAAVPLSWLARPEPPRPLPQWLAGQSARAAAGCRRSSCASPRRT